MLIVLYLAVVALQSSRASSAQSPSHPHPPSHPAAAIKKGDTLDFAAGSGVYSRVRRHSASFSSNSLSASSSVSKPDFFKCPADLMHCYDVTDSTATHSLSSSSASSFTASSEAAPPPQLYIHYSEMGRNRRDLTRTRRSAPTKPTKHTHRQRRADHAAGEKRQAINLWRYLLSVRCHAGLPRLLCPMYTQVCAVGSAKGTLSSHGNRTATKRPLEPCREFCEEVRSSCHAALARFGFSWPRVARCEQFPASPFVSPSASSSSMCVGVPRHLRPPTPALRYNDARHNRGGEPKMKIVSTAPAPIMKATKLQSQSQPRPAAPPMHRFNDEIRKQQRINDSPQKRWKKTRRTRTKLSCNICRNTASSNQITDFFCESEKYTAFRVKLAPPRRHYSAASAARTTRAAASPWRWTKRRHFRVLSRVDRRRSSWLLPHSHKARSFRKGRMRVRFYIKASCNGCVDRMFGDDPAFWSKQHWLVIGALRKKRRTRRWRAKRQRRAGRRYKTSSRRRRRRRQRYRQQGRRSSGDSHRRGRNSNYLIKKRRRGRLASTTTTMRPITLVTTSKTITKRATPRNNHYQMDDGRRRAGRNRFRVCRKFRKRIMYRNCRNSYRKYYKRLKSRSRSDDWHNSRLNRVRRSSFLWNSPYGIASNSIRNNSKTRNMNMMKSSRPHNATRRRQKYTRRANQNRSLLGPRRSSKLERKRRRRLQAQKSYYRLRIMFIMRWQNSEQFQATMRKISRDGRAICSKTVDDDVTHSPFINGSV